MVVIFALAASATKVWQDLTAWPSSRTVQAPHSPSPQPYLVPVRREAVAQNGEEGFVGGRADVQLGAVDGKGEVAHGVLRAARELSPDRAGTG